MFDDLKRKIADKNDYITKSESEKKNLEVANVEMMKKIGELEKTLKKAKEEVQRLTLRSERGAPYYDVLMEFFPSHIHKFVDESHTCKCH
jgi:chromosome segregation ATPase